MDIRDEDIEVRTWDDSPRGGQHVARSDYQVIAVHKPTGIAAVGFGERSQLGNKRLAMQRLRSLHELALRNLAVCLMPSTEWSKP